MIDPNRLQHLQPPLVADGCVRCVLGQRKRSHTRPIEELNERRPDWVEGAHQAFVDAGALCHRTNTRAANRVDMAPWGLEERCEALNNSGAASVRAAAGREGVMMGSIGAADPAAPQPDRERAYSEQVVYLSDTGADFLLLEHFDTVAEAALLIRLARRSCDTPVLAQLTFDAAGRTADGVAARDAAKRLADTGADALGLSCGPAPAAMAPPLDDLLAAELPVSVMMGIAGDLATPAHADAPALAPEAFAEVMMDFARRGAAIVGGCCNVMPAHIAALARARRAFGAG